MPLELLRQIIKEQIEKINDPDLLDFIYKLLASESSD